MLTLHWLVLESRSPKRDTAEFGAPLYWSNMRRGPARRTSHTITCSRARMSANSPSHSVMHVSKFTPGLCLMCLLKGTLYNEYHQHNVPCSRIGRPCMILSAMQWHRNHSRTDRRTSSMHCAACYPFRSWDVCFEMGWKAHRMTQNRSPPALSTQHTSHPALSLHAQSSPCIATAHE